MKKYVIYNHTFKTWKFKQYLDVHEHKHQEKNITASNITKRTWTLLANSLIRRGYFY
jgi:hypothetical protein